MDNLFYRSIASFVILGIAVFVGVVFIYSHLMQQENDSRIVNIAGRQRMLSQRISKASIELAITPLNRRASLIEELSEAIQLFEISQNALRFGSEELGIRPNYSEDIVLRYEALDSDYRALLSAGRSIVLAYSRGDDVQGFQTIATLLDLEDDFLVAMNDIVFAHDLEASTHLAKSRISAFSVGSLIILTLVLLWLFLVSPNIRKSKEIDKAKSEFVSLASHQLRSPLSVISWYSEMLLQGDVGEVTSEQREWICGIRLSSQRMTELVNALLNVSRIDLGTFAITLAAVDIRALAIDVVDEVKVQTNDREQNLSVDIAENLPVFQADEKLLRMVFQNLLSNASKYTQKGGKISLSVRLSNGNIVIAVSDSGIGIPKDQQARIFTKLFRAENAQISGVEGTGLGLYIVKSIIDNAGGSIRFESAENKGTTFVVSLPVNGMKSRDGQKGLL